MAYRLPSERVTLTSETGAAIEVAPVSAWALAFHASGLIAAYNAADPGGAELMALRDLYRFFVAEAQPTWAIIDHRGPITPTAEGMYRLPLDIALPMIGEWIGTLTPKSTAVDEMVPPSPLRDQLNAKLRAKRKVA